jgi:hypothetical protein
MKLLHASQGIFALWVEWYNFARVNPAVTHAAIC